MPKILNKPKRKKTILNYILSFAVLLLILYITFRVILKDVSVEDIRASIISANPWWVTAGFALMLVYIGTWAQITRLLLTNFLKRPPSYKVCLNTCFTGFYFNNITPSSTGGQPMQMLYMHKCGINVSGSSVVYVINTIFNNIVMISMATLTLITQKDFISKNLHGMKYVLIFGYVINSFLLLLNLFVIFSSKQLQKLSHIVLNFFSRKNMVPRADKIRIKIDEFFAAYQINSSSIIASPLLLFRLLLLHILQFSAYYLVPYTALRALGADAGVFMPSFYLQTVLTLAVSGFPTPGAVGITEGGFVTMFSSMLASGKAEAAMILTRFINFYAFLILTAVFTIIAFATASKNRLPIAKKPEPQAEDSGSLQN